MHESIDLAVLANHLLKERKYTTRSLAHALGISQPSASRLASGRTKSVSADVAIRLIRLCGGAVRMPAGAVSEKGAARDAA